MNDNKNKNDSVIKQIKNITLTKKYPAIWRRGMSFIHK